MPDRAFSPKIFAGTCLSVIAVITPLYLAHATVTQAVYCDDTPTKNTSCALPSPNATPATTGVSGLAANSSSFDNCCQVLNDNIAPMEALLGNVAADYYKGQVRNPASPEQLLTGVNYPTQTCNLSNHTLPMPYPSIGPSPQPEASSNYLASNCDGSTSAPQISQSTAPTAGACQFTCSVVNAKNPALGISCSVVSSSCALERAWTRGAFMQLVWKHMAEVEAELRTRTLNVSSQCLPPTTDAATTFTNLSNSLANWRSYWQTLGSQNPPPIPSGCANDSFVLSAVPASASVPTVAPSTLPSGTPYMAGNLLCAARKQIESFPFQVGACEVLARAETEWATGAALSTLQNVIATNLEVPYQICVSAYTHDTVDSKGNHDFKMLTESGGTFSTCISGAGGYAKTIEPNFAAQSVSQTHTEIAVVPSNKANVQTPLILVPPQTTLLACTPGAPTTNTWEPLTCGTNPNLPGSPFVPEELSILVTAGNSLVQTQADVNAAATYMSNRTRNTGFDPCPVGSTDPVCKN